LPKGTGIVGLFCVLVGLFCDKGTGMLDKTNLGERVGGINTTVEQ